MEKIIKENNKYIVSSLLEKEEADKLVLGIGGISFNNDRINYNNIIHNLNVSTTKLTPSLTPIATSSFPLRLEGKRRYCNLKLMKGNNIVKEEKEYGARPITRAIQDTIEDKITDALLAMDYENGHTFNISCTSDLSELAVA